MFGFAELPREMAKRPIVLILDLLQLKSFCLKLLALRLYDGIDQALVIGVILYEDIGFPVLAL